MPAAIAIRADTGIWQQPRKGSSEAVTAAGSAGGQPHVDSF
jgi:hypothetical protein